MDIITDFVNKNIFLDYIIIYDKLIVITNPDCSGNNKIECYDKNLTLLWKLTPPIYHMQKGNVFVSVNVVGDSCIVNDFNGVRYWVKLATGEIYSKEFVK